MKIGSIGSFGGFYRYAKLQVFRQPHREDMKESKVRYFGLCKGCVAILLDLARALPCSQILRVNKSVIMEI